jgi:(R,R)-butanediol dehydrogenase / meso-butanediol dehydrogenase / diacetyl reductase
MRAARYHGNQDIRVEEAPEPVLRPGTVAIRVAHVGICGSDLHEYYDGPINIPHAAPHRLTGARIPMVVGHEFSGVVDAVADDVAGVAVGDRVAIEPVYRCGECAACRNGHENQCAQFAVHGMQNDGGLAELTVVPAAMVHRLPDAVSLELGALVEPMAVCYRAVRRSGAKPGDRVVVFGAGPIGIGILFMLKAAGVEHVVVVEASERRRAVVAGLGAQEVLDPAEVDVVEHVRAQTGGLGADLVFDAAGAAATFAAAANVVAPEKRIVLVALYHRELTVKPLDVFTREAWVTRVRLYTPSDVDAVIALMAEGRVDPSAWVEHLPLDRVVEGYGRLRDATATKILIDIEEDA